MFFLEAVPAHELLAYMSSATLLIQAYKPSYAEAYAFPHKVMEYLTSGKVVVSTYLEVLKDLSFESAIAMTRDDEEFTALFDRVISDLPYWNSTSLQTKRRSIAAAHSYERKIDEIEVLISALPARKSMTTKK